MSEFIIDFNRVKRSELPDLFADMDKVVQARDISGFAILDKWMARTITQWPYTSNPGDLTTYADLGLADYMEAIRQFSTSFRGLSDVDARRANGRATHSQSDGITVEGRAS